MMCVFFFVFYHLFQKWNLKVTLLTGFKFLTNWYHSMSLQILVKHLVWKHFITISIFGLSYKVVCCQNFAFINRYHTLCEGRNYQIYYNSTVRSRFICLLIQCNKLVKILDLAHGVAFRLYSWQREWQEKNILHSREYLLYTFIALKEIVVESWLSYDILISKSWEN